MKRVLIIKMSSMGDVIHTLPALTDVQRHCPDVIFDWVVEPGFSEIPLWHPQVKEVLNLPLRQWRKSPWETYKQGEWHQFIRKLRYVEYDAVIDAQGLLKSALVSQFARGHRYGLDRKSAREPLASFFYQTGIQVPKHQHAVERTRQLFAQIFKYPIHHTLPNYGIDKTRLKPMNFGDNTVIFLHGTTWATKHWPVHFWQRLGYLVARGGYQVLLPWGNETERARAQAILAFNEAKGQSLTLLPKLSLSEITTLIAKSRGVIAVDTGLGHIAAAMETPTVSMYGPTDPSLTGAYGPNQHHLKSIMACAPCFGRVCKQGQHFEVQPPCFESITPERVWQHLLAAMDQTTQKKSKIAIRRQLSEETEIL